MNIIKSKNGTLYVDKNEGNISIDNARIKKHHDNYDYLVIDDRFYTLEYKGNYYNVVKNTPFISIEMYKMLENEYEKHLQDLKANRDFYEIDEIYIIKGKIRYISELLNESRKQLERLGLLK